MLLVGMLPFGQGQWLAVQLRMTKMKMVIMSDTLQGVRRGDLMHGMAFGDSTLVTTRNGNCRRGTWDLIARERLVMIY